MALNMQPQRKVRQVVSHRDALRTAEQLREHYEIEKELANRLRSATREERRRLYNEVYDERLQRIPHHPLTAKASNPKARLAAVAPQLQLLRPFLRADQVFMELGPGDCALAMAVAPYVQQVYAVDVSDGLVQEQVRPDNFTLAISDGLSVPVPPSSVHMAYSNQLMEHLHPEDATEQLTNIYNALTPGGKYICITPNRLSGPWDISRHFDETATGFHLHEYTIAELAAGFRQVGFRQVRAFLSHRGHHLSPQMPDSPFRWLEWGVAQLPRTVSRNVAQGLIAVKLIAIK